MKVTHLITSLDPNTGGPAIALLGLASRQAQLGIDVSIVTSFQKGGNLSYVEKLQEKGVTVNLSGPTKSRLPIDPGLKAVVRKNVIGSDVVHMHGIWDPIIHIGSVLSRKNRIPYVIRSCGMLDPWCLAQSRIRKKIYAALLLNNDLAHAAAIHYTTEAEEVASRPFSNNPNAIIAPNGCEFSDFDSPPPPNFFRNQYPEIGDKKIILFLGRVHYKKCPDLLIKAYLQSNLQDTCLVFAGPCDKQYRDELEHIAAQAPDSHHILFSGAVYGENKIAAYQDASLFCLPSHQENFGNVVIESLAAGTPVLISKNVNLAQQLEPLDLCTTCDCNVESIKTKLEECIVNNNDDKLDSAECKSYAREHFDWSVIAKKWETLYRDLMKLT